jgi:hypothetical protein
MALDSFSKYGNSFQSKILARLLTNLSFISQVYDLLDPTIFEAESTKEIVRIVKGHYLTYNSTVSIEVLKNEIDKINVKNPLLGESVYEKAKEILKYANDPDSEYVQNEFMEFCKNQHMKSAILTMADLLGKGDFESINTVFKDAQKFGADRNIGMYYEDVNIVEERLLTDQRTGLIETEWGVINEIVDGGFGAGDLIVLIGSAGSGKSWMLSSIGAHALKLGKSVLHVTLELSELYTSKRYDSRLTSIVSSNLKFHVDDVKEAISDAKGKLTIKFYPTKSITVHTLRALVERATLLGRKPDLVIVDYGDLIKSDNAAAIKGGSYHESGGVYEDLRGLAGEFQIPFITASQSNRGASEKEIITGEDVAESFKKIMIADVVISLSRKTDDKINSTGRVHIIKNRYGPDGLTFPSNVNANIGNIIIHSPTSIEGKNTKKMMDNSGEEVRKKLSDKYKDYEN